MFFRRERTRVPTLPERIEKLQRAGFTVNQSGPAVRAARKSFAIDLREEGSELLSAGRAGILMGGEIGALVDGGFQKFFRTPSGKRKPALAEELKAIHDFQEDLREALGMESLYN